MARIIKVVMENKHFINSDYTDNQDCPLHRAIRQKLKIKGNRIEVYAYGMVINNKQYKFIGSIGFTYSEYKNAYFKVMSGKPVKITKKLVINQ